MFVKSFALFLIVAFFSKVICESDEYIQEVQEKCRNSSTFTDCGKLSGLKFVSSIAKMATESSWGWDTLTLVKINQNLLSDKSTFFPTTRQLSSDGELVKFIKFVQRGINHFLESHALSIPFPYGMIAREVGVEDGFASEARKRKKLEGIIPLIIIFQLLKVKAMSALILVGLAFIKKAIIIAAIFLPSLFHTLKGCKHHHHVYPPVPHLEEVGFDHDPKGFPGYYPPNNYENGWERAYKYYNLKQPTNKE